MKTKEQEIIWQRDGVRLVKGIGDRIYIEHRREDAMGAYFWFPCIEAEPVAQYQIKINKTDAGDKP